MNTEIRNLQSKPIATWEYLVLIAGFLLLAEVGKQFIGPIWDIVRMAYFGVVGLTFLVYFEVMFYTLFQRPLIIALIVYAALSTLWSDDPAQTIERSIAMFVLLFLAVYFAVRFSPKEQLRFIGLMSIFFIIGSILFIFLLPSYGAPVHEWQGVFLHKNTLGRMMVIAALVALTYPDNRPRILVLRVIGYLLALWLIYGADSMTSLLLLVIITAMSFGYRLLRLGGILSVVVVVALSVPTFTLVYGLATMDSDAFLNSIGRESNLTGRTEVWENVSLAIEDRPLLGYGYGAFFKRWDGVYGDFWSHYSNWAPGSSHHAYLDITVNIGYLGLFLFMIVAAIMVLQCMRYVAVVRSSVGLWPILYISFLLMLGFSEDFILYNNLSWMLFISTAYSLTLAGRLRSLEKTHHIPRPYLPARLLPQASALQPLHAQGGDN